MAQKPMTKTQLVAALAEEMGSDKKTAGAALDAVTAIVTKEVANGGAVTLPGIGKVYCRERPERMVRNPATGRADQERGRQAGQGDHRQGAEGQRQRLIAVH
jgi:DNA-binding protein HU-beta